MEGGTDASPGLEGTCVDGERNGPIAPALKTHVVPLVPMRGSAGHPGSIPGTTRKGAGHDAGLDEEVDIEGYEGDEARDVIFVQYSLDDNEPIARFNISFRVEELPL